MGQLRLWLISLASLTVVWGSAGSIRADETVRQGYRLAPKAFRAAVAKVEPSLVTIETFGGAKGRRPV
jgi:hypothetical protein